MISTAPWDRRPPPSPAGNIPGSLRTTAPFRRSPCLPPAPKVNQLLLGPTEPLTFLKRQNKDSVEVGDDWLDWLVPLRDRLLDLLRDRSQPLNARLRDFLLTAYEAQALLDEEDMDGLAAFCAAPQAVPTEAETPAASWEAAVRQCLMDLEILEPDWKTLLERWGAGVSSPLCAPGTGKAGAHRRVSCLPAPAESHQRRRPAGPCPVLCAGCSDRGPAVPAGGPAEALRLFSREIEHDEDNLDALLEAFWQRPELALPAFLAALEK